MNLDEYIGEVRRHQQDPACAGLAAVLEQWKGDDCDVRDLVERVERHFGNSSIEGDEVHEMLYAEWVGFRQDVVEHIGGQTMNERLYWFGLSERYDQCRGAKERDVLYAKLMASP